MAKALPKNNSNSADLPAIYKSGIDREEAGDFLKRMAGGFFGKNFGGGGGKSSFGSTSIVKTTPDELLSQDESQAGIESTGILQEIKDENVEQTTLLKNISKHMLGSEEDEHEAEVDRQEQLRILEDIRDGIVGGRDTGGEGEEKSTNSGGLISGMLGGLLAPLILSIKTGFMTAIKFLFNPRNILRILGRVFAPIMIVGSIVNGIMDGFKVFTEGGSIKEALIAGLGGMLEFLTFGLFDKEKLSAVIDYMSGFVNDYILGPLGDFMSFIGESFDKYIKQPILSAFESFVEMLSPVLDPIMSMFDTLSGVIGKVVDSITGFLQNIEIPGVSFSVLGKKVSFGPWAPFAKDTEETATVEPDNPKAIDTRKGFVDAGDQSEAFSDIDPSAPPEKSAYDKLRDDAKSSFGLGGPVGKIQNAVKRETIQAQGQLASEYGGEVDIKMGKDVYVDGKLNQEASDRYAQLLIDRGVTKPKEKETPLQQVPSESSVGQLEMMPSHTSVPQFTEAVEPTDAPVEKYDRNKETKKRMEEKEKQLGRRLLDGERTQIKMAVKRDEEKSVGNVESFSSPSTMDKLSAETPNTPTRLEKMSEPSAPPSAMSSEMAAELGRNIKISIPPTPAAPQSQPQITSAPFTQKMPNRDSSFGRYIEKGFDF